MTDHDPFDPDRPVWWTMCGNEGRVTIFGPYGTRDEVLYDGELCQNDTDHHYLELTCSQLVRRLPPVASVDWSGNSVAVVDGRGEYIVASNRHPVFRARDLSDFFISEIFDVVR